MSKKHVYFFGSGKAEGNAKMKELLGGKGANLAEMASLGLPVPPGFTITTDVCTAYYGNGKAYPDGLDAQLDEALDAMARVTGKRFGDAGDPLLVSVRSGARASMPGMEARPPERTETSSGSPASPNRLPVTRAIASSASSSCASNPSG